MPKTEDSLWEDESLTDDYLQEMRESANEHRNNNVWSVFDQKVLAGLDNLVRLSYEHEADRVVIQKEDMRWALDRIMDLLDVLEFANSRNNERWDPSRSPLWFHLSSLADWIECEFPDREPNECLGTDDVAALREAGERLRRLDARG